MDAVILNYPSHLVKFLWDFNVQYLYVKRFCWGCIISRFLLLLAVFVVKSLHAPFPTPLLLLWGEVREGLSLCSCKVSVRCWDDGVWEAGGWLEVQCLCLAVTYHAALTGAWGKAEQQWWMCVQPDVCMCMSLSWVIALFGEWVNLIFLFSLLIPLLG